MDAALRQATPFGKYVLLERVSVGGMAEVFKAKAFGVEGFEKILAIKRILPSMAEDADFIEMFIDEAKICGQLNHANICQIYELGRVADSHFIAMEYVWGKDVLQMQNRFRKVRQKMKPEMAAYIVCKICEGLDYAHKKKDAQGKPLGIIHRDISPQNVLVSYEGELKVIDFGIAKAASRSSKTQAGVLKGKFGYMSPEQVRGLPLDRRSDIFAIGTLLYELLTSERLFYGESDFETLEKVRNVDVLPPSQVNPAVPKSLERIILRALSKDVEGRYQWASEMAEELSGFLLSQSSSFAPQDLSQWMREQFAVEMNRERLVLDEQQKVTRDLLVQASTVPIAVTQAAGRPPQKSAPKLSKPAPVVAREPAHEEDDDFNEKTTVSGPAFGEPAPVESLPEQSTRILDSAMSGASTAGDSQPAVAEIAAQHTVLFSEASGQARMPPVAPAPLDGRPYGGVIVGDPSQVYPPQPERSFTPHYGQLMPPSPGLPRPPRSTMGKDILIGVAVAAAVVGCILGLRLYAAKRAEATLVVVSPTEGGELLVDGTIRGKLAAGSPMTLKAMSSGEHSIVVRGEAGEFSQSVTLGPGDVNVVTATFSTTAPQLGKLKLEIEAPSLAGGPGSPSIPTTADIYLDGAQISTEAARGAISLRVGAPHEVRVVKPGYEEKKFSIDIKAGETMVRPVRLDVSAGTLTVISEPPGAEVTVNGKHAGLTPTTVRDLEPGRTARISLRLSGHQSVTKSVSFDKSAAPQTIEVHLSAGKDTEPSEPGAKDPDKNGDKSADNGTTKPAKPDHPSKPAHATSKDPVAVKEPTEPAKDPVAKPTEAKPSEAKPSEAKPAFPADGLATVSFGTDKNATQEPGFLVANTQPWAKVLIDGKDTGKTTPIAPRAKIALKAGKHVVTFVVSGKKYNFDITVKAGEEVRLIKQLSDAAP